MGRKECCTSGAYETHRYLCWLDQIRGIGRKSCFSLLLTAAQRSLFEAPALEKEHPLQTQPCTDLQDLTGFTSLQDPSSPVDLAGSAGILYKAPETQLRFLCREAFPAGGRGEKIAALILAARKQDPNRIIDDLHRAGIRFVSILEEGYPLRLRNIPDPPFGLYCRGSMPADTAPAVGVIGARLASGYGREQARRFGYQFGRKGITVISGMARGIDGIAQKAALEAGGTSFAVLGCGVDLCYPEENRPLYEGLLQEGGILSEYPPGIPPEPKLFPPRNRIISGLSDVVLVIEARKKSGTLITVDMALEQGKEVYALPGRVSDRLSDGCNRLLRQGANVATCPEDILEFFSGIYSTGETAEKAVEEPGAERRSEAERTTAEQGAGRRSETEGRTAEQGAGRRSEAEGTTPEQGQPALEEGTPASVLKSATEEGIENVVLHILSSEEEIHLERLLEAVSQMAAETKGDRIRLSDLTAALFHLQAQGRVREETPGYFMKTGS